MRFGNDAAGEAGKASQGLAPVGPSRTSLRASRLKLKLACAGMLERAKFKSCLHTDFIFHCAVNLQNFHFDLFPDTAHSCKTAQQGMRKLAAQAKYMHVRNVKVARFR